MTIPQHSQPPPMPQPPNVQPHAVAPSRGARTLRTVGVILLTLGLAMAAATIGCILYLERGDYRYEDALVLMLALALGSIGVALLLVATILLVTALCMSVSARRRAAIPPPTSQPAPISQPQPFSQPWREPADGGRA
ncbi:hypothetical protein [Bifidobacterium leontopitheci]|uniref:Uncharacterized protein n=1 Tax=Bifidobacterium leontopitheci TaxID=2650774 RepID=A0A6I1GQX1_9BIFI|nr:hypothetical protein [Bifidobacterium leontopitheci]KAB7790518.1 hypothetical protein F7D09_1014 [Bifidobacterium leontopitheci]